MEQVHVEFCLKAALNLREVGFDVLKWFSYHEWLCVKQNIGTCLAPEGFSLFGRETGEKV